MAIVARRNADEKILTLLAQAGANAAESAQTLRTLIASFPEQPDLIPKMKELETRGDRLTHRILVRLQQAPNNAGLLPEEGFALATAVDDIVDHAEQTADMMGIYGIEAPMEQAVALSDVLVAATSQVAGALNSLQSPEGVAEALIEINRIENEGDQIYREALASLFSGGIDPMVVIRWKDIFTWLEASIDSCEEVAHRLEGIALRRGDLREG
jgi:uncharacterized protein